MRAQPYLLVCALIGLSGLAAACTRGEEPTPVQPPVEPSKPVTPAEPARPPRPPLPDPLAARPDFKDSPTLKLPIEWKELAPLQAGFKVRFPRLPERMEKTDDSPDGPIAYVAFVSLAPEHDGAYSLAVTKFPKPQADRTDDEQFFEDATWVLVHNTVGKILEKKDITVQERKGREFKLSGAGPMGKTTYFARIFRAGDRGYQLFAAFPEGKEKHELASRFLDSFQFTD